MRWSTSCMTIELELTLEVLRLVSLVSPKIPLGFPLTIGSFLSTVSPSSSELLVMMSASGLSPPAFGSAGAWSCRLAGPTGPI